MNEWINVEDSLPPKDGSYFIAVTSMGYELGHWYSLESSHYEHIEDDLYRKVLNEPICGWNCNYFTHWMPLAPLPTTEST